MQRGAMYSRLQSFKSDKFFFSFPIPEIDLMLIDLDRKTFEFKFLPNQEVTQDTHQISSEPSFHDFSEIDIEDLINDYSGFSGKKEKE